MAWLAVTSLLLSPTHAFSVKADHFMESANSRVPQYNLYNSYTYNQESVPPSPIDSSVDYPDVLSKPLDEAEGYNLWKVLVLNKFLVPRQGQPQALQEGKRAAASALSSRGNLKGKVKMINLHLNRYFILKIE